MMQETCRFNQVIFDFDSTLIVCESLELIMIDLLQGDRQKIRAIEALTNAGMNGDIGFRESLEARLKIAQPSQQALRAFVQKNCPHIFTIGIKKLIQKLHNNGVKVWIMSGGFSELILPFASVLNIPSSRVCAVNLHWDEYGVFKGLNNDNGFCDSKVIGARKIQKELQGKTVVVGDGFTDYEIFKAGIADQFIAYMEHVKREKVIEIAPLYVSNTQQLMQLLF